MPLSTTNCDLQVSLVSRETSVSELKHVEHLISIPRILSFSQVNLVLVDFVHPLLLVYRVIVVALGIVDVQA